MSIPVAPADLAKALADFGSGYLLTTSSPQVKVVTVDPVVTGEGRLRIRGPGRGTLRNIGENPVVTVVLPPAEQHGYTLLVDGTAVADGEDVVITATAAVLHRPAAHAAAEGAPPPPEGCGHDCAPVG